MSCRPRRIKDKRTLAGIGIVPRPLDAVLPSYLWRFSRQRTVRPADGLMEIVSTGQWLPGDANVAQHRGQGAWRQGDGAARAHAAGHRAAGSIRILMARPGSWSRDASGFRTASRCARPGRATWSMSAPDEPHKFTVLSDGTDQDDLHPPVGRVRHALAGVRPLLSRTAARPTGRSRRRRCANRRRARSRGL